MYDTQIICTYNTTEVFLETDNITDSEKDFVCNVIYRQEFLNIFKIDSNFFKSNLIFPIKFEIF